MRCTAWWRKAAQWSAPTSRSSRRQRPRDIASVVELLEDRLVLSAFVPQPNFNLTDVNTTSTSFESKVSPRDYVSQTSVWYFSHST